MITTILFNYLYPTYPNQIGLWIVDCGLWIYYCNDMQLSIFFTDT